MFVELCRAHVAKSKFSPLCLASFPFVLFVASTVSGVGAPAAAASTRSPFLGKALAKQT